MTWVRFRQLSDVMGKILRIEAGKPRPPEEEFDDAREGRETTISDPFAYASRNRLPY